MSEMKNKFKLKKENLITSHIDELQILIHKNEEKQAQLQQTQIQQDEKNQQEMQQILSQ